MVQIYLSIGSNLGDRLAALIKAARLIDSLVGKVMHYSEVVETEPWGFTAETSFYNQVLMVESLLEPQQVLEQVLVIEKSMGRERPGKGYSSRVIDIDILFYDHLQIRTDNLVIPHPYLHKRNFVLAPMNEIAPELIHPDFQVTISELYRRLDDPAKISVVIDVKEFARLITVKVS